MVNDRFEEWAIGSINYKLKVQDLLSQLAKTKVCTKPYVNICSRCRRKIPPDILRGRINNKMYCLQCYENKTAWVLELVHKVQLNVGSIESRIKQQEEKITPKLREEARIKMRDKEIIDNL